MRIGVWYNVRAGGAKRALHDHVAGLLERGHQVEAWCPPTADRTFLPLERLVPERVLPLAKDRPPWWAKGRFGLLRNPRAFNRALSAHCRACAEEMEERSFDVHLIGTCQFVAAPPIGKYLHGPTVLYLQEPFRALYEPLPTLPWLAVPRPVTTRERLRYPGRSLLEPLRIHRRSQRARFETDNARAFDQLLVNSLFSRENLLRIYGIEPKVCYLGVDTEVFRPTGAKREDMVLGVGTFFAAKNAGLLVEAVARLDPPRPRVEWISPGADEESERALHEAADRAEVELTIRRSADDQTLVDALNRARALAYTPRLEPFGLVPLEANACELPVIGVSEGGVRETVIDGVNGLLVEPTADELASAIHRLMTDQALAARLGREGRRIVTERWTLDAAAERLEAALEESLARGG